MDPVTRARSLLVRRSYIKPDVVAEILAELCDLVELQRLHARRLLEIEAAARAYFDEANMATFDRIHAALAKGDE